MYYNSKLLNSDFLQEADGKTVGLLLDEIKITEKDPEKIVKLLKSVPAEDLIKAHANLVKVFNQRINGLILLRCFLNFILLSENDFFPSQCRRKVGYQK